MSDDDEMTFTVFPEDVSPPTSHEYSCEVCGVELRYGGRGRKPKYCDDHKRQSGAASGKVSRSTSGKASQLAAQATEALAQINSLSAIGLLMAGMPLTSAALAQCDATFREQAYAALLTQPDLCKTILKAGTTSGLAALVMAYAALGVSVLPVGISEYRQRRAAAESARAGDDGTGTLP